MRRVLEEERRNSKAEQGRMRPFAPNPAAFPCPRAISGLLGGRDGRTLRGCTPILGSRRGGLCSF